MATTKRAPMPRPIQTAETELRSIRLAHAPDTDTARHLGIESFDRAVRVGEKVRRITLAGDRARIELHSGEVLIAAFETGWEG